jgi:hypothetical protein
MKSRVSFAPAQFFRVTICKGPMSALGQKLTCRSKVAMSALPPKADIDWRSSNVGFVPKVDIETNLRLEKIARDQLHAGCGDGSNDNCRQSDAASMNRVRNSDCFFQAQQDRLLTAALRLAK